MMNIQKFTLIVAAVSGMLAVGIGAFGAHALRASLEASGRSDTFETAVKYQFYHTLALLLIGLLLQHTPSKWLAYSAYSMMGGILVFSGSLYTLCFTGIRALGAITPIGGVAFIIGWVLLAVHAYKLQG